MKVVLATPATLAHGVDVYYHHSAIETIKLCAKHGIEVCPITWPGEALIQHARNALVEVSLAASDVQQVFWVDADQEWEPEWFLRMVKHPVDVVGATTPKKQDIEAYPLANVGDRDPKTGLHRVGAIGTGFLRVSRRALQTVWDKSERYEKGGKPFRMVFDVVIVDGQLCGEDAAFCIKLAMVGYPVWLDTSFTVGHNGYKRYKGDFLAYMKRTMGSGDANQRPSDSVSYQGNGRQHADQHADAAHHG